VTLVLLVKAPPATFPHNTIHFCNVDELSWFRVTHQRQSTSDCHVRSTIHHAVVRQLQLATVEIMDIAVTEKFNVVTCKKSIDLGPPNYSSVPLIKRTQYVSRIGSCFDVWGG
jgi:hypothetical protein